VTIHAFTDGASRGNPGESGVGIVLKDERGKILSSVFGYIGKATNNIAEYTALITCLKIVRHRECQKLVIHSDSELLVRQMEGVYKIKEPRLKKLSQEAKTLIGAAGFDCSFRHIVRDHNREADKLANLAIDTRQPLQVGGEGSSV
jgi:ribonuclease HI